MPAQSASLFVSVARESRLHLLHLLDVVSPCRRHTVDGGINAAGGNALSATAFLAPIKHVAKKTWTDRPGRAGTKSKKQATISRHTARTCGKATTTYNGWGKDKKEFDNRCGVSNWTLHDLRRTFATEAFRSAIASPGVSGRIILAYKGCPIT
jgi:hypothetical protein